jgi:hypothetical protein
MFGELAVDATDLEPDLVDLPERGRVGMQREQPGCNVAEAEVEANHEKFGERAGVTSLTVQEMRASRQRLTRIRERLHAARKLVEILEESEAFHDDRLQRLLYTVANTVEMHAKALGDPELLARYEQTRAYRSAVAKKGVRTRLRNQQAAVAASTDTPVE